MGVPDDGDRDPVGHCLLAVRGSEVGVQLRARRHVAQPRVAAGVLRDNADTYGEKYATTNAGLLYTAKGTAALLVPFSSILSEGGEWHIVFYLAAVMAILAGVLAIVALKPMRQREIARSETISGVRAATTSDELRVGATGEV